MASHTIGPGESLSTARITAYCGVAVALISAIGGVAAVVVNIESKEALQGPITPAVITAAGITPTPTATSLPERPDTGLRFSPLTNGKLTVSGSTRNDVAGMYVMIGPKSAGGYDTGCGNVVNQRWQTEVPTDASWPNYPLVTVPAYGSCTVGTSTLNFAFHGTETTTPPPPSDQILDCAMRNGPVCFSGPGFGPPTVYQPNQ